MKTLGLRQSQRKVTQKATQIYLNLVHCRYLKVCERAQWTCDHITVAVLRNSAARTGLCLFVSRSPAEHPACHHSDNGIWRLAPPLFVRAEPAPDVGPEQVCTQRYSRSVKPRRTTSTQESTQTSVCQQLQLPRVFGTLSWETEFRKSSC